jgi:hypothetical protein
MSSEFSEIFDYEIASFAFSCVNDTDDQTIISNVLVLCIAWVLRNAYEDSSILTKKLFKLLFRHSNGCFQMKEFVLKIGDRQYVLTMNQNLTKQARTRFLIIFTYIYMISL